MQDAKNNKSTSKTSMLLLIIGFCFFVNPVPYGFDFVPDVFGCALIYFGLTQLAYFDGMVEKARRSMLWLFVVELVKLISMDVVSSAEISSNRMLAVAAFSILQGILYVMFIRQFFGGLSYYTMRHNCNNSMKKCDDTAFLTYSAFFARILATLLPELIALIELEIYFQTDFKVIDSITDIVSAKPVIVVMLSLIALVANIAWIISMVGLLRMFHDEAHSELDQRYYAEYASRPEMVRPKKLRFGSYTVYLALVFSLDLVFDYVRILPSGGMFLLLFVSTFFWKSIYNFKQTKKFALPAFILLMVAEIIRAVFVPNGAIYIYETELWVVLLNGIICLVAIPCAMLCVRSFLAELRGMQKALGGSELSTTPAWVSYCVMAILWTAGFVVPYFYSYVSTLRLFASAVFIWQTAKLIVQVNDEEFERFILYDRSNKNNGSSKN